MTGMINCNLQFIDLSLTNFLFEEVIEIVQNFSFMSVFFEAEIGIALPEGMDENPEDNSSDWGSEEGNCG